MRIFRAILNGTAVLVFAASVVVAPARASAGSEPGERLLTVQAKSATFSAKQLQQFAKVAQQVFQIRQKYAPDVQVAGNEKDARAIIDTAQAEMEKAIEKEGMTIEGYNQIISAAQKDPALAGEIQKIMDQPR